MTRTSAVLLVVFAAAMGQSASGGGYVVVKKTHASFRTLSSAAGIDISNPEASDLVVSSDGRSAWAAIASEGTGFYQIDLRLPAIVSHWGEASSWAQALLLCGSNLLLVTDNTFLAKGKHELRPPPSERLEIWHPSGNIPLQTIPLCDSRLHRTVSETLTTDNRFLWLATMNGASPHIGYIPSALFKVDLQNGHCQQIAGHKAEERLRAPYSEHWRPDFWMVARDEDDWVYAADPEATELLAFAPRTNEPKWHLHLGFRVATVPRTFRRYLPLATDDGLRIVDCATREIGPPLRTGERPNVRASCTDSTGQIGFMALPKSTLILQIDLKENRMAEPLDLSREGGTTDFDGERGRVIHDISTLRWADDPPRLLALGFNGHLLVIAELAPHPLPSTPSPCPTP